MIVFVKLEMILDNKNNIIYWICEVNVVLCCDLCIVMNK